MRRIQHIFNTGGMNQKRDCINWRQIISSIIPEHSNLAREELESEFKVAKKRFALQGTPL
jgi:hypothetical protein